MKHKILLWSTMLLMLMATSCREESDVLQNYAANDGLGYVGADSSFAVKFKALWKALDQNYALWDYERDFGLDWDKVYDEYLPQYEALDQRNDVTDEELSELLSKTLAPLHDGHFMAQMENHQTGSFVDASPNTLRIKQRPDYAASEGFEPDLKYYYPEDEDGNGEIVEHQSVSTRFGDALTAFLNTPDQGQQWITNEIERLEDLKKTNKLDQFKLTNLKQLKSESSDLFIQVIQNSINAQTAIQVFNELAVKYAILEVPGLNVINPSFIESGIKIEYALFRNNIVYLTFDSFSLTAYLDEEECANRFPDPDTNTEIMIQQVRSVWEKWFNTVQDLHKKGQLKGVIVDIRSNGGGYMNDFKYVLGSMLPSGGFSVGSTRYKRGIGRYDYSPLSPLRLSTLEKAHETITEPVVVLANCNSLSMAEMTSLVTKVMPNGTLIGKTTQGGLCGLHSNPQDYPFNYSGIIGEANKTPIYLYLPSMAFADHEGKFLDGVGVTPDIDVDLDTDLLDDGRDTQLERAVQFLNTGK